MFRIAKLIASQDVFVHKEHILISAKADFACPRANATVFIRENTMPEIAMFKLTAINGIDIILLILWILDKAYKDLNLVSV